MASRRTKVKNTLDDLLPDIKILKFRRFEFPMNRRLFYVRVTDKEGKINNLVTDTKINWVVRKIAEKSPLYYFAEVTKKGLKVLSEAHNQRW